MSESVATAITAATDAPAVNPETTVKPEVKSTEHIDKFASKFAALTRKEKEFNEKFKSKETEYNLKLSEIEENRKKYAPYEQLDKEIGTNKAKAIDFLLSKGLTVDEIGQMLMDHANPDPETKFKRTVSETEAALRAEIKALRDEFDNKEVKKKESEEEAAKKQHEKVVQGVIADLTDFVNKSDEYELIRAYDNVSMVYEVMNQHYMEQVEKGIPDQLIKILSYKEACDAVESHLDEQVSKTYEAKRAKQSPKKEDVREPKTTQTLSNTLSAEVPVSGERQLSKEEKMREAAKMLRWVE
jgi:DNA-binding transcriptional MerR regulator